MLSIGEIFDTARGEHGVDYTAALIKHILTKLLY